MRFLIVADIFFPDIKGGSGRVIFELGKRLANRGHVVDVLTRRRNKAQAAQELLEGMSVYRYAVNTSNSLSFFVSSIFCSRSLAEQLFKHKPYDILIFNQPLSSWAVIRAKAAAACKRLYIFHSSWAQEYFLREQDKGIAYIIRRWMEKRVLRRCQDIVVLSEYSKNNLQKLYPRLAARLRVIPAGIDLDKFKPAEDIANIRRALGISQDKKVLFTLRNFTPRTGVKELLKAMLIIRDSYADVLLVIGGSGHLFDQYKDFVHEAGLEDMVKFTGPIKEEQLVSYYQMADFFILPSQELEGFGLVTLEALACAIPVLATPVAANKEILSQLDENLLCQDSSPEAIARLILRYLAISKQERLRLSSACRRFVETKYSWDKMADAYEQD